ncbi:MAG: hypothetical protein R6V35_05700 [Candidatus Nanohaloarchaea archaeon]
MEEFYNNGLSDSLNKRLDVDPSRRHSFGAASEEVEDLYDEDVSGPRFYRGFEGGLVVFPREDSIIVGYLEQDSSSGLDSLGLATPMGGVEDGIEASTVEEAERAIEKFFRYDMKRHKSVDNRDYLI